MIQIKLSSKFEWFLAILIAVFIKLFILIQILGKYDFRSPDSPAYLLLSKNLAESYLGGKNSYSDLSLLRTPGYPFFLNIFSTSVSKVILAQIFISIAISIVLVLVVRKLSQSDSKIFSFAVFIISQIETSLFVYSYKILTEMLFAFLITLFIYLLLLIKNIKNVLYAPLLFVILIFAMLVRPIGIVFVIVFAVLIFITPSRSLYVVLFLISLLIIGTYSFHNYSKSGIFVMSTVQNVNLLMYEGAGAKAISVRSTLGITQSNENSLRNYKLGDNPTVYEIDNYNFNRGLELILENKISFIRLHIVGVAKILFGPNKFELNELFSAISPIFESRFLEYLVVIFSLLTTLFISFFGFVGAGYFFKYKETQFLSVFLFVYLIFTSGANAYGRFRAPIAPILIIFASLFVNHIYRTWKQIKSNN